jgi:hypothetical protein
VARSGSRARIISVTRTEGGFAVREGHETQPEEPDFRQLPERIRPEDVVEAQASDIARIPGDDELGISLSHPTDRS